VYKHEKDISEDSDYRLESNDCAGRSTQSQRSSVTEYDHMLGHSDRSRTSQKQHRSVSVTQEQFNDRYDPQSTYSDRDPPASMLYDVTEVKHDIYPDEVHRCGHHERKHDHCC
jgi:U11/U12 small nuclear ribonucleoprotein 48 kDa protein